MLEYSWYMKFHIDLDAVLLTCVQEVLSSYFSHDTAILTKDFVFFLSTSRQITDSALIKPQPIPFKSFLVCHLSVVPIQCCVILILKWRH